MEASRKHVHPQKSREWIKDSFKMENIVDRDLTGVCPGLFTNWVSEPILFPRLTGQVQGEAVLPGQGGTDAVIQKLGQPSEGAGWSVEHIHEGP